MKVIHLSMIGLLLLAACDKRPGMGRVGAASKKSAEGKKKSETFMPASEETGDLGKATPGYDVVWKRYRAFEDGIVNGLGLKREDFCKELGAHACVDKIHLTVLGGNEPYQSGQYERAQVPTVLTAVAVDRIVLTACSNRLEMDRGAGEKALVFKHFPLSGSTPTSAQIEKQTVELYQRLLARDPEAAEKSAAAGLSATISSPDKLALMLCYAVGTAVENILL